MNRVTFELINVPNGKVEWTLTEIRDLLGEFIFENFTEQEEPTLQFKAEVTS